MQASTPPFQRLATSAVWHAHAIPGGDEACCPHEPHQEHGHAGAGLAAPKKRIRLAELNPHFFCSILGTCLSTDALRRVASRHVDTQGLTDLDVHHAAVAGIS